jgi:hypothetical protein
MDQSISSPILDKLPMYLAVKAVCDAKPSVWQRSEAFEDAFTDYCRCLENIARLQPALGVFNTVAKGIAVELEVADRILTNDMDELIEQFEAVDESFVDEYTAARCMEVPETTAPSSGTF